MDFSIKNNSKYDMSFELIATKSGDKSGDLYPDDTEDMFAAEAARYREHYREIKEKGFRVVRKHFDGFASFDVAYLGQNMDLKKVERFVREMQDAQITNVEKQKMKDHANIFWKNMFPKADSLRENTWSSVEELLEENGFYDWVRGDPFYQNDRNLFIRWVQKSLLFKKNGERDGFNFSRKVAREEWNHPDCYW